MLIEKDEQVLAKLEKENHLEILFEFILAPDRIYPNTKARKRFAKYETLQLDIKKKKQYEPKNLLLIQKSIPYIPEKHNVLYFRAEKAMMLLMLRSNYKVLKRVCPRHVDIFYEVLTKEVLVTAYSKVDMAHVLKLIQYFLAQSPTDSVRNIIKYHIVYELLVHCDYPAAADTLIALITPGDNLFKIEDKDRQHLSEYLRLTNFGEFLIKTLENFKINDVYEERGRMSQDSKIQDFCSSLVEKMSEPSEKRDNFLVRYFHSLFNKELLTRFHKQPEDLFTKILNVDRLPQKSKSRKPAVTMNDISPRPNKLVRATTVGNLENLYDVIESEELAADLDEERENLMVDSMNSLARRGSLNIGLPMNADGYLTMGQKNLAKAQQRRKPAESKRSKILRLLKTAVRVVMCNNLFLLRPQKKTQLKMQKKASYSVYPEKITITNQEIRDTGAYKSEYLKKTEKTEPMSCSIAEVIYGIVSTAVLQRTHRTFNPLIRLNGGSVSLLTIAFFKTDVLVVGLLKNILFRMPTILDNKASLQSAYWSLRAWLVIAKHM